LSAFTKACFIGGQAAHKLANGGYNIDAGKNDIRAYYEEDEETIKFFCRYERDMKFYDKKLKALATKHSIDTKP
jgi:hypothetical protein